jgi:septation ring formation regulator EzrA
MKFFTSTAKSKAATSYLLSILLLFVFTSISCADTPADSLNKNSPKYLSFYENADGERIHWEANFIGDEITSIYKNGNRIPDDLVADYKDKVYDQLDEMRIGDRKFNFHVPLVVGEDFHFDMEKLHKDLEDMKKDLPELKENFQFHYFDSEEFEKEMEELKKELEENKSHIYKFKFDEEEFKEEMEKLQKELKENLPKLKKFKFEFDIEEDDDTEV